MSIRSGPALALARKILLSVLPEQEITGGMVSLTASIIQQGVLNDEQQQDVLRESLSGSADNESAAQVQRSLIERQAS